MRPELKNYLNACDYLKDYYAYRKALRKNFSYEAWAREIGQIDRSYLRMVSLGQRPLSEQILDLVKNALFDNDRDKNHFTTLVHYSQAKTKAERDLFGREIIQFNNEQLNQKEIEANYTFLSNTLIPRLQTLLSYSDSPFHLSELAEYLKTDLQNVQDALSVLQEMDLIEKTKDGYKAKASTFKVNDIFMNVGLRAFYENSFEEARKAIDLPKTDRRFKTYYIAMTDGEFEEYMTEFQAFMKEQLQKRNYETVSGRKIYQLQLNAFAATLAVRGEVSEPLEANEAI